MNESISYSWRDPITDDEMVDLVRSHGGNAVPGWWSQVKRYSLGWVGARFRPTDAGLIRLAT